MKKNLLLIAILAISLNSFSQKNTLIFDTSGKLIYEDVSYVGVPIKVFVKGDNSSKNNYVLRYECLEEKNYQSQILNVNSEAIVVLKEDAKGFLELNAKCKNHEVVNYQLIAVNGLVGIGFDQKKIFSDINNTHKTKSNAILSDFISRSKGTYDKDIDLWIKKNKELGVLKKEQELLAKSNHPLQKELGLFKKEESVKQKVLESLSKLTHVQNTQTEIVKVGKQIKKITEKIGKKEIEIKDKIASIKRENTKLGKEKTDIKKKLTKGFKKLFKGDTVNYFSSPAFTILHEGTLVQNNEEKYKNRETIVYDINYNETLDKTFPQLEVSRINTTLPELTNESQLFVKVINLKPSHLKNNPFKISLTSATKDSVFSEATSDFEGLQKTDDSILGFIDDIGSIINPIEEATSDTSDTDGGAVVSDAVNLPEGLFEIVDDFMDLKEVKSGGTKAMIDSINKAEVKVAKYFKLELLKFTKDREYLLGVENIIKKSKTLTLEELITFFDLIRKSAEDVTIKSDSVKTLASLKTIYKSKSTQDPNFTEFLLKYPTRFKSNTATTINLYSNEKEIEGYKVLVEKGKKSKPSYTVSYKSKLLASDELPAIQGLKRFKLTTGVFLTNKKVYSYQRDVMNQELLENSINTLELRPSITFSTYHYRQNFNQKPDCIWNTLHYDISIDYGDSRILDNVYAGVGLDIVRNLHLVGGFRFASIDRIDRDIYDFSSDNQSEATKKVLNVGFYLGLNLGLDLVPKVIKTLF